MARGTQSAQHDGFVAVDQPFDCQQCVAAHAKRFEFPTLPDEAAQAWRLYHLLQDQVRVGMDVVGLDYTAIPMVFDLYAVPLEERRMLFEQVVILNHAQQEHRALERARESSRQAEAKTQRAMHG